MGNLYWIVVDLEPWQKLSNDCFSGRFTVDGMVADRDATATTPYGVRVPAVSFGSEGGDSGGPYVVSLPDGSHGGMLEFTADPSSTTQEGLDAEDRNDRVTVITRTAAIYDWISAIRPSRWTMRRFNYRKLSTLKNSTSRTFT